MPADSVKDQKAASGGPEHFAQCALAMGTPPVKEGSWNDLHIQTMRLNPGGWAHPGTDYVRLTIPLAEDGRVRRRLPGESKSWVPGLKRQGTVSVTPPGTEGEWEWLDESHFGLLFLPEILLREALDEAGSDGRTLLLRPAFAETDPVVGAMFAAIHDEIGQEQRQSRLLVSSAALFLARYVLRRFGTASAGDKPAAAAVDNRSVQRVIDAVDVRLGYDWSVHEMAREAGLSPFWFAHVFKETVGVSPRRFVQRRRLACARRLLADCSLSVTDIAAHCGFESQSWFTTAFKREFGVTPASYRRHCQ